MISPGDATFALAREDDWRSRGRDVYLIRAGGAGYALVLVDDLGLIEAAMFCAAS